MNYNHPEYRRNSPRDLKYALKLGVLSHHDLFKGYGHIYPDAAIELVGDKAKRKECGERFRRAMAANKVFRRQEIEERFRLDQWKITRIVTKDYDMFLNEDLDRMTNRLHRGMIGVVVYCYASAILCYTNIFLSAGRATVREYSARQIFYFLHHVLKKIKEFKEATMFTFDNLHFHRISRIRSFSVSKGSNLSDGSKAYDVSIYFIEGGSVSKSYIITDCPTGVELAHTIGSILFPEGELSGPTIANLTTESIESMFNEPDDEEEEE